jgi:hypothetical protein
LKALTEEFRGIKYVRISSLPENQRKQINSSLSSSLIIKILREGTVLHDCLQYNHYAAWYENIYKANPIGDKKVETVMPVDKFAIAS